jgi:hypothetical protein
VLELAFPLLPQGGSLVAWKSASGLADDDRGELAGAHREIAAIDPGATIGVERGVPEGAGSVVESLADHRLVVVTRRAEDLAPTWPREPAARKRKPW